MVYSSEILDAKQIVPISQQISPLPGSLEPASFPWAPLEGRGQLTWHRCTDSARPSDEPILSFITVTEMIGSQRNSGVFNYVAVESQLLTRTPMPGGQRFSSACSLPSPQCPRQCLALGMYSAHIVE